ncbi:MAG: hypothetical protein QXN55_01940 [Candidatus Nitrosotenuis sp.]|jgi:chromosome segregation ATPase
MHSAGNSPPKKGAGYFANRLKEKGVTEEPKQSENQATLQGQNPDTVSPDPAQTAPKVGQIFEESTKSIASMADEASETAKLVSSMKEGLERVTKIKQLLTENPLCDDTGSCSYNGVNFTADSAINEEKIANIITKYAQSNISDLQSDANSIREELQQFRNTIKEKESQIAQFREKLSEIKQHTNLNSTDGTLSIQPDGSVESILTEFDAATTDQDLINFNSIQGQDYTKLTEIQQHELREGEKKLLELRWKIKKAEMDYEQKIFQKDQLEDLSSQIKRLESKKDALHLEVKNLENQNKEPKQELKELEQRISHAKKEYDEMLAAQKEVQDTRSVLEYLKLDKHALKSEIEELRSKTKLAEQEYQERKSALEKIEDVRFTVSSMQAEKETLQAELEKIHSKIKKVEADIEQRQQEKEKLGEFKAIVTHLRLEKESLEQELGDLKSKIKKCEVDYEQKRLAMQELQDVRDVLAYLKPERDLLKSEISQLRDKIQKLEENYDDLNSKKRQCQLEYDDLKFQLKRLETKDDEKRNSFSHFTR